MSELLNEEVEAAIDEMVEESIVDTYYRMGHLISEISAGLARKVADKRQAQFRSIKHTMTDPDILDRSQGRDGKLGGPVHSKDRFDIDDQGHRARKGLSGKKDAKHQVDQKERPAYEKRHRPTTMRPTGNRGVKTRENPSGETLYTKGERRAVAASRRAERKEQAEKDARMKGTTPGQEDVKEIKRRKREG